MRAISFFPIGTKVNLDGSNGTITQIKFSGNEYQVSYLVSWVVDQHHYETWMYSMEFKTTAHRVNMKFTIRGK